MEFLNFEDALSPSTITNPTSIFPQLKSLITSTKLVNLSLAHLFY